MWKSLPLLAAAHAQADMTPLADGTVTCANINGCLSAGNDTPCKWEEFDCCGAPKKLDFPWLECLVSPVDTADTETKCTKSTCCDFATCANTDGYNTPFKCEAPYIAKTCDGSNEVKAWDLKCGTDNYGPCNEEACCVLSTCADVLGCGGDLTAQTPFTCDDHHVDKLAEDTCKYCDGPFGGYTDGRCNKHQCCDPKTCANADGSSGVVCDGDFEADRNYDHLPCTECVPNDPKCCVANCATVSHSCDNGFQNRENLEWITCSSTNLTECRAVNNPKCCEPIPLVTCDESAVCELNGAMRKPYDAWIQCGSTGADCTVAKCCDYTCAGALEIESVGCSAEFAPAKNSDAELCGPTPADCVKDDGCCCERTCGSAIPAATCNAKENGFFGPQNPHLPCDNSDDPSKKCSRELCCAPYTCASNEVECTNGISASYFDSGLCSTVPCLNDDANCCNSAPPLPMCYNAGPDAGSYVCCAGSAFNIDANQTTCDPSNGATAEPCEEICCLIDTCATFGEGTCAPPYTKRPGITPESTLCGTDCIDSDTCCVKTCKSFDADGQGHTVCTNGYVAKMDATGVIDAVCGEACLNSWTCCEVTCASANTHLIDGGDGVCSGEYEDRDPLPDTGVCGSSPIECVNSNACCVKTTTCSNAGGARYVCGLNTEFIPANMDLPCDANGDDSHACQEICCTQQTCGNMDGMNTMFKCKEGYQFNYDKIDFICSDNYPSYCTVHDCCLCEDVVKDDQCDTAWAYDDVTLVNNIENNPGTNKPWGWHQKLSTESVVLQLLAGAGGNVGGTPVGTVTVTSTPGDSSKKCEFVVTFDAPDMSFNPHLYIGNEKPTDFSPGQLKNNIKMLEGCKKPEVGAGTAVYTCESTYITGSAGACPTEIYVAAQATVCPNHVASADEGRRLLEHSAEAGLGEEQASKGITIELVEEMPAEASLSKEQASEVVTIEVVAWSDAVAYEIFLGAFLGALLVSIGAFIYRAGTKERARKPPLAVQTSSDEDHSGIELTTPRGTQLPVQRRSPLANK